MSGILGDITGAIGSIGGGLTGSLGGIIGGLGSAAGRIAGSLGSVVTTLLGGGNSSSSSDDDLIFYIFLGVGAYLLYEAFNSPVVQAGASIAFPEAGLASLLSKFA
jgi:hypothetical protein